MHYRKYNIKLRGPFNGQEFFPGFLIDDSWFLSVDC